MSMAQQNSVRIIGGKWRGRRITFPSVAGLRPTHDRIRETVFNWLMQDVAGANCLDLFAGSGAMGIEALSRGAAQVTFIDHSAEVERALRTNLQALDAQNATVIRADYHTVSSEALRAPYDIIFLDPPFGERKLNPAIAWLEQRQCLNTQAKIYIEIEKDGILPIFSKEWSCSRHKSTSTLDYYLFNYACI